MLQGWHNVASTALVATVNYARQVGYTLMLSRSNHDGYALPTQSHALTHEAPLTVEKGPSTRVTPPKKVISPLNEVHKEKLSSEMSDFNIVYT